MTRIALCAALYLMVAWPPIGAAQQEFVDPADLREAGLVRYWQLELPLESDQRIADVYLLDDALYVGTNDGYVYALDARTGVIRWLQRVTRSGYRVRQPAHVNDRVYFVTPVDLQAYNRRTGDGIHRSNLRFPPGTGVRCDGERLFIGGLDRRLYVFKTSDHFVDWRIITSGPIVSNVAFLGEHVFVVSDVGGVYSCTRADKVFNWESATFGAVEADLVASPQGVFVASRDASLYLFDLNFGQTRWRVRFSAPLTEPPALTETLAFQYCDVEGIAAIELEQVGVDKRVRWFAKKGRKALTIHDQNIYLQGRRENLLVARLSDGEILHEIRTPGFSKAVPAMTTQSVYLVDPNGKLICARPRGVPPLDVSDLTGASADETEAAAAPTTQPVIMDTSMSAAQDSGPPAGGKSQISKQWGREGQ